VLRSLALKALRNTVDFYIRSFFNISLIAASGACTPCRLIVIVSPNAPFVFANLKKLRVCISMPISKILFLVYFYSQLNVFCLRCYCSHIKNWLAFFIAECVIVGVWNSQEKTTVSGAFGPKVNKLRKIS